MSKRMKLKLIVWHLLILIASTSFSQDNRRPSRSRFYNSKFSTFFIQPGDTLVYSILKDSVQLEFLLRVEKFGRDIRFNYTVAGKEEIGDIEIQPVAVSDATIYRTPLSVHSTNFTDTTTFWLSRKNYNELVTTKETTLDLGDGSEIFKRQRIHTVKIRYKGKEKILTVLTIESIGSNERKVLSVLTEESNPLIIKMDAGLMFTLKEVR